MAEKYRGIIPPGSIWFHLDRAEALNYIEVIQQDPDLREKLAIDRPLSELEDIDILTLPGNTEGTEKLLEKAGIKIVTLFD